jgi:hypothetical protein
VQLRGAGIRAELPRGWEGAIRRATPETDDRDAPPDGEARAQSVAPPAPPVVHLSTFPLPPDRGDFGSGAVELMRDGDSFVALLEYGPDEVGSALFASEGLPRRLDPRVFSTSSLQRAIPGQAGWQHFFTEAGRPFCLYVVLGDHLDAHRQLRRIEQVLADVTIEPA